jgi:demethoxyubiquinone hydroxylase (CLK1/Coq7/Cat5 family)
MEGKRYKEEPAPINDSLERHYKEEIKRLAEYNADLEHDLNEMRCEIERLHFKIKLKDIEIESLVKSMAGGEM